MNKKLLDLLACPGCKSTMLCQTEMKNKSDEIIIGSLECRTCSRSYPISNGIPRFISSNNYAQSFAYQWDKFQSVQIDSLNHTKFSEKRFYSETGWTDDWIQGKWILDAGCGAGRFIDVVSRIQCEIIGVDISTSVDAVRKRFGDQPNVHLVQASIYALPFKTGVFDGCYCIGVIQHTPDPEKALASLPAMLKKGGKIAITVYERKPWTFLFSKYLVRPFTIRLHKKLLLFFIQLLMPLLFLITEVLFRIPFLGRFFRFAIPVANYVNVPKLPLRLRYQWAILDTFDMLSPRYDKPLTQHEAEKSLIGISPIGRLGNPGLNLAGIKQL